MKKNKKYSQPKPIETAVTIQQPSQTSKGFALTNVSDLLTIVFCCLYFIVEFIPNLGATDDQGPQWVYLVLLDIGILAYFLNNKGEYSEATYTIFNTLFSKLYTLLFLLAGVSIFFAINRTEGWVCYVRFIATVVAFFNISILLYKRQHLFDTLTIILSLIVLYQSIQELYVYFSQMGNMDLVGLTLKLKGNAGNKNIFAASIMAKVPFVMYGLYHSSGIKKMYFFFVLLLTVWLIYLLSSRTTYIALISITFFFLCFCFFQFYKQKKKETLILNAGSILVALTIAYFLSVISINAAKNSFGDDTSVVSSSVIDRIAKINSAQDESRNQRLFLWDHAFHYGLQHPLMGCGFGNWKFASIPPIKYLVDDLSVPVHAHNDFLEFFAELGLLGGLLFLSLFLTIAYYSYKVVLSNQASSENKIIAFFSLLAMIGYGVDAFFNFPIERPVNQLFFAFFAAVNIMAYTGTSFNKEETPSDTNKEKKTFSENLKYIYSFVAILFLIPSAYVTFLTYQSFVVQNRVIADLQNEPLKLPIESVINAFPTMPNVTSSAQPIDGILGRYLYEKQRYDEAITYLDRGIKANPYIMYCEFLKADVYFAQNKGDSALKYASLAFFTKPRAKTYYQTLVAVCVKTSDTVTLKKAYLEFVKYRPKEPLGYSLYLQGLINIKMTTQPRGTTPQMLRFADSVLKLFPNDSTLLIRRNEIITNIPSGNIPSLAVQEQNVLKANQLFNEASALFTKGDFDGAAKKFIKSTEISNGSYGVYENIAICYFNMRQWEKSLPWFDKVFAMKTATDGKSEYFKGAALINLGKKDEACALLKISKSKGYAAANDLINSYCK
ncbi:MAG: O-antigen ligase family protein [Chitinophagia bacterium]|jgi:O-antigen ligase